MCSKLLSLGSTMSITNRQTKEMEEWPATTTSQYADPNQTQATNFCKEDTFKYYR